jgi:hypothetical protein
MRRLLLVFIGALALLNGCKKNDGPSPCLNAKPTSAQFGIYEDWNGGSPPVAGWRYIDCDTVATTVVRFAAKDSSANVSYEWRIGAGVYRQQTVVLNFPSSFLASNAKIPVKLIIRKTPNTSCFPTDKGIDSVTRVVNFLALGADCVNSSIGGVFKGYRNSNPLDTATISIKTCVVAPGAWASYGPSAYVVNNVVKNCTFFIGVGGLSASLLGYRQLIIDANEPYSTFSACMGSSPQGTLSAQVDPPGVLNVSLFVIDPCFCNDPKTGKLKGVLTTFTGIRVR